MLKPGFYILSQKVVNPTPDRRHGHKLHNWMHWPEIQANFEFYCTERAYGRKDAPLTLVLENSHGRFHADITEFSNPELWELIVPLLTPKAEGLHEVLHRKSAHHITDEILQMLVNHNKVSLADVEEMIEIWEQNG